MYLYRTLCDVLDEMRKAHETHNYSYLSGLIEEAQSMGNRMESGLSASRQLYELKDEYKKLNKKKKNLQAKIATLEKVSNDKAK